MFYFLKCVMSYFLFKCLQCLCLFKCVDFMAKNGAHSASSAHWDRPLDGLESLLLRDKLAM